MMSASKSQRDTTHHLAASTSVTILHTESGVHSFVLYTDVQPAAMHGAIILHISRMG